MARFITSSVTTSRASSSCYQTSSTPHTRFLGHRLLLEFRGAAARRLKRILVEGDETYGVVVLKRVMGKEGCNLEAVERFMGERWEEVERLGVERGFGREREK